MNEEKINHAPMIAPIQPRGAHEPSLVLPISVATVINGRNLESKCETAIELLTHEDAGFPHVAHLSSGELQLDTQGRLRVALWSSSQTTANLRRTCVTTLMFVCPDGLYEVRCRCIASTLLPGHAALHAFLLQPISIRDKSAPYAQVLSGIRYRLVDRDTTLQRWYAVQAALSGCF
jgi:hypothetical protein